MSESRQFQFSEQEIAMLKSAIDAWCRQGGANVAVPAAGLLLKLNNITQVQQSVRRMEQDAKGQRN